VKFLLDTCVVSELVKPAPDAGLSAWMETADEAGLHLSVITVGEIRQGIAALSDTRRRRDLDRWLHKDLIERFAERVLPFGVSEAEQWGQLSGEARRGGSPVPVVDAMIAATALCNGLVLVTRNVQDFQRLSVRLENPWSR
jgi:hypothetical protein